MWALARHLAKNEWCICVPQIKTSQKDQCQTSLPAETCPSREGKSSYKILKKKEVVTSTFLATGERGTGEGGGVGIKTETASPI